MLRWEDSDVINEAQVRTGRSLCLKCGSDRLCYLDDLPYQRESSENLFRRQQHRLLRSTFHAACSVFLENLPQSSSTHELFIGSAAAKGQSGCFPSVFFHHLVSDHAFPAAETNTGKLFLRCQNVAAAKVHSEPSARRAE